MSKKTVPCKDCGRPLKPGDMATQVTYESGTLDKDGELSIAEEDKKFFICEDCALGRS